MFADDINLFLPHKNIDTLFVGMNVGLKNLSTWFRSNNLSLNIDENKWLLFHPLSKKQLLLQTFPNFFIENIHTKREGVTKFFGVFIHEGLSWKQHINIVSSKISKSIVILYKSRDVLSKQCLKQLHFSFTHNYELCKLCKYCLGKHQ